VNDDMTDYQFKIVLYLLADHFEACKNMDELREAIKWVRELASSDDERQG
jgi:hypothetical protein